MTLIVCKACGEALPGNKFPMQGGRVSRRCKYCIREDYARYKAKWRLSRNVQKSIQPEVSPIIEAVEGEDEVTFERD